MKTLLFLLTVFLLFLNSCDNIVDEQTIYDYSIEQEMDCFCPQSGNWIKLFISADTVAKAYRISDNHELSYYEYNPYKSIEELNKIIEETDTNLFVLKVNYDEGNNYPNYIYKNLKPIIIDDSTRVEIADAQFSYKTKNYIKLK